MIIDNFKEGYNISTLCGSFYAWMSEEPTETTIVELIDAILEVKNQQCWVNKTPSRVEKRNYEDSKFSTLSFILEKAFSVYQNFYNIQITVGYDENHKYASISWTTCC